MKDYTIGWFFGLSFASAILGPTKGPELGIVLIVASLFVGIAIGVGNRISSTDK